MIVAGAGGHAIELLDILINNQENNNLVFYDDISPIKTLKGFHVLKSAEEAQEYFVAIQNLF